MVVPFAALLPVIAPALAQVLFGYGAAAPYVENYVPSLALFGPGLVVFTVHYLMLRGFYALEQTRAVFAIQCAVSATNVLAAVLLVAATDDRGTSPALVGAYSCAYLVGSVISALVLRQRLGGLDVSDAAGWPSYLGRLLLAVGAVDGAGARDPAPAARPARRADDAPGGRRARAARRRGGPRLSSPPPALLRLNEVTSVLGTVLRRASRS